MVRLYIIPPDHPIARREGPNSFMRFEKDSVKPLRPFQIS